MTEQLKTASAVGLTTIDKLRLLLDITNKISRSLDLQEVLNLVMDTLDSLIPYDAAGIFIVNCGEAEQELDEPCVFEAEAVRGAAGGRRYYPVLPRAGDAESQAREILEELEESGRLGRAQGPLTGGAGI
jgi:GAF domain-containing protein